ncbi:MAG: uracil-DNA glycosylase family protein [Limisphaerales bacterium]
MEYRNLLDSVIAHLEDLHARGVQHVAVDRELLASLSQRTTPTPAPAPSRTPTPAAGRATGTLLTPQPAAVTPVETAPRPIPSAVMARWGAVTGAPAPSTSPASPARPSTPLPPRLDPAAKATAWEDLRRRILACTRCPHLVASRNSVVFGVGTPDARLMFIGEAPGADEDVQGEPFVGKAGELLTRILGAMGLQRSDVLIANILKCRPDTPGQTAGNRKPNPEEMGTCLPWLEEQINLVQPEVLVALGATAVEGLLGKTVGITRLRGAWQTYRGIPLMPTYHPAYLLRNQAPSEKRRVWEDMMAVMERLGMPISEKQRNYFLTR